MSTRDVAILLGGKIDEATGIPTIDVLTRTYGRRRGRLGDSADQNFLERGCSLQIEFDATDDTEASTIVVDDVTHISGNTEDDLAEECAMIALKTVADALIPLNQPDAELYDTTQATVEAVSSRDPRWPIAYASWEIELLSSLHFVHDLGRCRPALRHGETVFYSPRSNRLFTRAEAGAFLDKVLPVPAFLLGSKNALVSEVLQALDMTKEVLIRHALEPSLVQEVMKERAPVVELISKLQSIPRIEKPVKTATASEADIKRRLLASRPLKVSYSVTASR